MPRMSLKPETYLRKAKEKAFEKISQGDYWKAIDGMANDMLKHPLFKDHPAVDKTCDFINLLLDDSVSRDELKNKLVEHLNNDY